MACPVINIQADTIRYLNFSSNGDGIDVQVSLSFTGQYSNLNYSFEVGGVLFENITTTSFGTGFLVNLTQNDDITMNISLENANGDLCSYSIIFNSNEPNGDDQTVFEAYYEGSETVSGTPQIAGCTDPTALNYNALATISIDTCIYPEDEDDDEQPDEPPVIVPATVYVEGCTNPLAVNYSPMAQINDGSCIFLSGCTLPFADNYNDKAVIDDGSCTCDDYTLLFDLGDGQLGFAVPENSGTCTTVVSFDWSMSLNCEDIIDLVIENPQKSVKEILNDFAIVFKVFDTEYQELYSKQVFKHNFNDDKIPMSLNSDDFCEDLFLLLRQQERIACDIPIESKYVHRRNAEEFIVPAIAGKNVLFTLQFQNIKTRHCVELDNIKVLQFCNSTVKECALIPKQFGFELNKIVDNEKTSLLSDELILNTKEIDLRVNPLMYIDNDINDYFRNYAYLSKEGKLYKIDKDKIDYEFVDARNRQKVSSYIYRDFVHLQYLNSQNSCAKLSKQLDYHYADEVYNEIGPFWRDFAEEILPATTISTKAHYFYRNIALHQPKHIYKGYTLDKGCDGDATAEFEIITDDPCVKILDFKSRFEQITQINGICDQCVSSGVTYSYFDDGNNESGRIVQYSGNDVTNIIETINFDTVVEQDCPDQCEATVFITDTYFDTIVDLTVEFSTSNVKSSDAITGFYDGIPMMLLYFDEALQQGAFFMEKVSQDGVQVIVSVQTQDCGQASDEITLERCDVFLPVDFNVLNPSNPNYEVQYFFFIYGTEDPDDLQITANGVPINDITYLGNAQFRMIYTRNVHGNDIVIITATMPCGTITEQVINNPN